MNEMTSDYPDELTPATMAEYEAAMTIEASTCGLPVHDVELLTALRAIEAGRPFLVKDQWLVATGQHADGTIAAMSVDRAGGKVQIRRWKLTVAFIYALLCEDGIAFPGLPMSLCAPIPVS